MTDRIPISDQALDTHFMPSMFSTSLPIVSASLKGPSQEVPDVNALLDRAEGVSVHGAEPVLGRADWDFLVAEREAIMHEAGMASSRCLPMALADTQRTHGPRPGGAP